MIKELKNYPLFSFFESIKSYDRSIGHNAIDLNAYLQLIDLIQLGRGLTSEEDLYIMCRFLLLKPYHKEEVFLREFQRFLKKYNRVDLKQEKLDGETKGEDQTTDPIINDEDEDLDSDNTEFDPEDEMIDDSNIETEKEEYEPHTKVSVRFEKSVQAGKIETPSTIQMQELEQDIYKYSFLLKGKYLPFSSRRLEQGIRSLRTFDDQGGRREVDFEATVERVSSLGYFDKVIEKYSADAITPLTIMIDWSGSMIAFHHMADELVRATYERNKEAGHKVFYFHDYPSSNVYRDKECTNTYSVELLKKETQHAFLIFSDGGAARGGYSKERIESTKRFLKNVQHRPCVWLNPLPSNRWKSSSAGEIAQAVKMFDFTMEGFSRAMKWLKKAKTG